MKIHRFYVPEETLFDLINDGQVEITKSSPIDVYFNPEEFIHQMSHVLRFRMGDIVHVFNIEGGEVKAEIVESHKKAIKLRNIEKIETKESNKTNITLGMSIIKKDNFELVIEKVTELGVNTVIPFLSDRSIKKELSESRILRIAKEATEQCGRVSVPEIKDSTDLEEILKTVKDYDLCLFGNMNGDMSFGDLVKQKNKGLKNILVLIGPEGGWTEEEIVMMEKSGVKDISINENTLRAETAAIGLITLLLC